MRSLSDCTQTEIKGEIHREEQGKVIVFRHIEFDLVCGVISMDDCVFKNTTGERSCDFLFLFDKSKQKYNFIKSSSAYYVELKGTDLVSACEQLYNSTEKTKDEIPVFELNAVVVSSRNFIPKYDNNEFYRGVKRIIRKNIGFEITPYAVNF